MNIQSPLIVTDKKNDRHICSKYLVILLVLISIVFTNAFMFINASAKAKSDCESIIKMAMAGKNSIVLQITNKFNFKSSATGVFTKSVNGLMSSTDMTEKQAQGALMHFLYDKIIRVKAGQITMDESDYNCNLQILPDNKGIAISMTRGDEFSVNQGQMQGIIKGNTMTVNVEVSQYSLVDGIGNGYGASGEFDVSIRILPVNEWPPMPPMNLAITENSDHSIKLSWKDSNPKGLVVGYDIYRMAGVFSDFTKIASIGKCSSWVDSSNIAKTQDDFLSYYIVAKTKNGKKSIFSNMSDINLIYRMLWY